MNTVPDTMRAVVLTGHGDLDKLVFEENWPAPVPGEGEVLACGLNNTDVNTRTAWYSKGASGNTTGGVLTDAEDADAAWGGTARRLPFH